MGRATLAAEPLILNCRIASTPGGCGSSQLSEAVARGGGEVCGQREPVATHQGVAPFDGAALGEAAPVDGKRRRAGWAVQLGTFGASGNHRVDVIVPAVATPGHTDHHLSYVVIGGSGGAPAVFTGGSLLYGSVGRRSASAWARSSRPGWAG